MKTLIITGGMIEADFALSFIQELKADYILSRGKAVSFIIVMTSIQVIQSSGRDSGTLPAGGRDPDPYLQSGKGCDRYKDRTG